MRLVCAAAALLALTGMATGTGGLVSGVGFGTVTPLDGSWSCADRPFHVDAAYLPNGHGIVHFRFAAQPDTCLYLSGGGVIIGYTEYNTSPISVELVFACSGTETQGMSCAGNLADGTPVGATIGPHAMLGTASITFQGGDFIFTGSFVAP